MRVKHQLLNQSLLFLLKAIKVSDAFEYNQIILYDCHN